MVLTARHGFVLPMLIETDCKSVNTDQMVGKSTGRRCQLGLDEDAMAKQAERRAATTEAILRCGAAGCSASAAFAATTMDDIAEAGAMSRRAPSIITSRRKEAVFEAVFEQVSRRSGAGHRSRGAKREGCAGGHRSRVRSITSPRARKDRPGGSSCATARPVLGWERWREIDARHFGGKISARTRVLRWTPA